MTTGAKAAWLMLPLACACMGVADAATVQVPSCDGGPVAAAVRSANDGDTVVIPAGTCTWTTSVTIDSKWITLQGAGANLTTIIDGVAAPVSGAKPAALIWNTKPKGLTRLTGVTFDGGSTGGLDEADHSGIVAISGNLAEIRLDHLTFTNLNRTVGIQVTGSVTGVIDHIVFNIGSHYGLYIFHDSWLGAGGYGDNSWAQPNTWGSAAFLFVEDCQFVGQSGGGINWGNDGWMGQRVVYRHNTYTNVLWANHGTETSGRQRSGRAVEVYQNTFILNNAGWNAQLCCLNSVIGVRGVPDSFGATRWSAPTAAAPGRLSTWPICAPTIRERSIRSIIATARIHGTRMWTSSSAIDVSTSQEPDRAICSRETIRRRDGCVSASSRSISGIT